MKIFNYINREHVEPIDLGTLGRTYNTLEQGHKEAVKATSDLKVTLANLDLNEAESGWRQGKLAELNQIVTENTKFGNQYGALDDVITQAGNLAADHGMIGRLQAQKDFKEYSKNLDSREDLPQDYKDFYKEKNPYYYKDTVDEKTGTIIGGTKWTPTASPTKVIPLNQLLSQGLSWAAKESGGGDRTTWLDSNGNPTSDVSKSYDGAVFNTTTNRWDRLSKEKIEQGIKAAIETTPGAKESLNQDYTISEWKYDKAVKTSDGKKPVVTDITDANGIKLTQEQYLKKKIDPMVQSSSYYNSITSNNYGPGAASYRAGKKAEAQAAAQAAQANSLQAQNITQGMMSGRNTPVDVPINVASNFLTVKNTTAQNIKSLYKDITGKELYVPADGSIANMEQLLNKHNIPVAQRQQLRGLVRTYNDSEKNLESFTKNMNKEDKANFDFYSRMTAGGELRSSANGGSKLDDKAIKTINTVYGKGDKLEINFGNDSIKKDFLNSINAGSYDGFKALGLQESNGKLYLPKDKMYSLPKVMASLKEAEKKANSGILGTIAGAVMNRFGLEPVNSNNERINKYNGGMSYYTPNHFQINDLASLYSDATEKGNNISKKYNINPTTVQLSSLNLDGDHFTDGTLLDAYNRGVISKEQYDIQKKYYDKSFDNVINNTDFSQMDMYYMEDGDNVKRKVTDSNIRFNYGSEILQAVKDKRVSISPSVVPGITDPLSGAPVAGYNVTILPDAKKGGTEKRFYIPGLVNETSSSFMMKDPTVQAFNTVSILGATKSSRNLTDYNTNPKIGNVTVQGLGANQYSVDFGGVKANMSQEGAVALTAAFNNYNSVKDAVMSEASVNPNVQMNERMRSTLVKSATTIGQLTNTDPNAVLQKLIDDINK